MNTERTDRVFVIANYWDWSKFNVLSLLIRVFCYGWNHVARFEDGFVHEMKGSHWKWIIKKKLGYKVSYAPNEGSGYTVTPLEEWLVHANRKVIELRPLIPLKKRERREGYGFLDLIQKLLQILRRVWLMVGNNWNGKDGTRLWAGEDCCEFVGTDYEIENPHLLAPIDYLMRPKQFEFVRQFETRKP